MVSPRRPAGERRRIPPAAHRRAHPSLRLPTSAQQAPSRAGRHPRHAERTANLPQVQAQLRSTRSTSHAPNRALRNGADRNRAIDLELWICVKPGHLPSDFRDRVLRRLRGDGVTPGYFNPDAFTFGTPIHRLTLEGVVGAVPGVLAVKDIQIGARTIHEPRKMEPLYRVPDNEIIRLANDPRTPERGSVCVYTEGGV